MALLAPACKTARPVLVAPAGNAAAARPVLFEGVRIFDGTSDALSPTSDLLVAGGRIAAVAPHGALRDERAAQAERVDGRGKTLLPGLVDAHVHLGGGDGSPPWASRRPNTEAQAAALVYAGVTTILSAARDEDDRELSSRFAKGELAGPRIVPCSRMFTAREGHPVPMFKALLPWPISTLVLRGRVVQIEGEADAAAAVRRDLEDTGAAFVKIVYDDIPPGTPHLTKGALSALVGEARKLGRRAAVHVGSPADALDAVEAGASILMHVPGNEPLSDDQVRRLAASGAAIVTTVRIYAVLASVARGDLAFTPLEREVMPTAAAADFSKKPAGYQTPGFPASYIEALPARAQTMAANAKKLFDAGARLVAGTDSGLPAVFHGAALHRELQALVALGIPAARVLRMATADAARALDPAADYGRIAEGLRADLLLVEGDPLADIAATERIAGVWQAGRRLDRRTQ